MTLLWQLLRVRYVVPNSSAQGDDIQRRSSFVSFVSSFVSFVNPIIVQSEGSQTTQREHTKDTKKFSGSLLGFLRELMNPTGVENLRDPR